MKFIAVFSLKNAFTDTIPLEKYVTKTGTFHRLKMLQQNLLNFWFSNTKQNTRHTLMWKN